MQFEPQEHLWKTNVSDEPLLFIILSGEVVETRMTVQVDTVMDTGHAVNVEQYNTVELGLYGPGEIVGENTFVVHDRSIVPYDLRAQTRVDVLVMDVRGGSLMYNVSTVWLMIA